MKTTLFLVLVHLALRLSAADFNVSSPGTSYTINGTTLSPTLTLVRGETYTFAVTSGSSHPLRIISTNVLGNITGNGTITWTVPLVASNYTYECNIHKFNGAIVTVPPPVVQITRFNAASNLVLRSTGTTNYNVLPEFKTNVTSTNWFALTLQSNNFVNGTNETFCGRPPGSNVFVRVKAVRK
jgi:hypothetical protein